MKPTHIDTWLDFHEIDPFLALAEELDVSAVARGPGGFLEVYRDNQGDPNVLETVYYSDTLNWADRRDNFVKRHMAQAKKNKEEFWKDGRPTRRHLALIMWAYTPELKRLKKWIKKNQPSG